MPEIDLLSSYELLLSTHGDPSELWPQWCAKEKTEELRQLVALGAILTQRTSWRNADLALRNLKKQNLLSLETLSQISDPNTVAQNTHPAGFHQAKPKRLVELASYVTRNYGTLSEMRKIPLKKQRASLLEINGIGPETADTILLYALDLPSFVIDEYTRRWMKNSNSKGYDLSYEELKARFETSLTPDVETYQNYHILMILDQKGREGTKMEIV